MNENEEVFVQFISGLIENMDNWKYGYVDRRILV